MVRFITVSEKRFTQNGKHILHSQKIIVYESPADLPATYILYSSFSSG